MAQSKLPSKSRLRARALDAMSRSLVRSQSKRMDQPTSAPLFIIGSGRSGNTLARRVLMASDEIYIPPETYVLGEIIENWFRYSLLPWRERVWLFCAHFEKHPMFPTLMLENLNEFSQRAIALPRNQRSVSHLIDTFYHFMAEAHGSHAQRWGDKTPYNTFHLDALDAAFPAGTYIWLVRDGRDVVLSYVKAGLFDTYAEAAERWVVSNHDCMTHAQRNPRTHRLTYETLVTDPEHSFGMIFGWAGLEFSPEMLTANIGPMGDVETLDHHKNVLRNISPASIGLWRQSLSDADLAELPESFWDMMGTLGYDQDRRAS